LKQQRGVLSVCMYCGNTEPGTLRPSALMTPGEGRAVCVDSAACGERRDAQLVEVFRPPRNGGRYGANGEPDRWRQRH